MIFCIMKVINSEYVLCHSGHSKSSASFPVKQQKGKCLEVLDRECSVQLRFLQDGAWKCRKRK